MSAEDKRTAYRNILGDTAAFYIVVMLNHSNLKLEWMTQMVLYQHGEVDMAQIMGLMSNK